MSQDRKLSHEGRILVLTLLAGLPGSAVALVLLWYGDFTAKVQWTLGVVIVGVWLGLAFLVRERVVFPLQTLSNLLAALREGDYSIRARGASQDEALGLAMLEVNALGETLKQQRLGAVEATHLLRKVMQEIDVAIFAFDDEGSLRLVNRGGERLLARRAERIMGLEAEELGLESCLEGEAPRIMDVTFPGGAGRYELRRSAFRQEGLPHRLVVLSDLTRTLRREERQAWQRLVQVLRHEINNSLAPIHSLAGSLKSLLEREPRPEDWQQDLDQGLDVIAERSRALSRFMASYARLTRLPDPELKPLDVDGWVRRVVKLETRLDVEVVPGPETEIQADGDQLDQLLINLVGNAVDAALETGGGVRVGWDRIDQFTPYLDVWVEDDGPGLTNTANLFVPFFTTKPQGSGIGLVLSRQIAEAHGGTLTLKNRSDDDGCVAHLFLPLEAAARSSTGA